MRTIKITRHGVEITKRIKTIIEIEMSDDHADCLATQIENLITPDPEKKDWDNQEAKDFVALINEILR